MVTYTIILLLVLAVAIMPTNLATLFTPKELADMGIRLENPSTTEI